MSEQAVSFVIIAYNAERTIERTVRSIAAQEGLGEHEIIVVDDGSVDGTAGVVRELRREYPPLRLVPLGRNRGRGFARATGVGAAAKPLVACVDADIVLPPRWLATCRAHLGRFDAVGGTAVPDGDASYLHTALGLTPRPASHTVPVSGSNCLIRRSVFERVNYDERRRDGEDFVFAHDLQAAGFRLATIDGLLVEHRENKGLLPSLRWMFESGVGASGHYLRYRRLRAPDVAFLGFMLSATAPLLVRGRRGAPLAPVLPGAVLASVSFVHVARKFDVASDGALKSLAAVGVDSMMLACYFGGRLVGLAKGAW